jgi:predicted proteasome-type protease
MLVDQAEPNRSSRVDLVELEGDIMALSLARFTITKALDETFLLNIEDDAGTTFELEATYEQLDLISEAIEEVIEMDADEQESIDEDVDDNNDD